MPDSQPHNPLLGIAFKIASVTVFVATSALIKAAGQLPAGQIVFFRSFFAIFPILIFLAYRRELYTATYTAYPFSHIIRGVIGVASMGLNFYAVTRLPLPDAVTIAYAQPLLVVAFSGLFLGEIVRAYRWIAVILGLVGVIIISAPRLTLFGSGETIGSAEMAGVLAAFAGATVSAAVMLLVRKLVLTERTSTVVLWFSLTASATALLSAPFGWAPLTAMQTLLLVFAGICGGVAQIFMTEAYRHAEAATVAPFEYTSMILAIAIGYLAFGDIPTGYMLTGGAIVIAASIFIAWREQRLGLKRDGRRKSVPPV